MSRAATPDRLRSTRSRRGCDARRSFRSPPGGPFRASCPQWPPLIPTQPHRYPHYTYVHPHRNVVMSRDPAFVRSVRQSVGPVFVVPTTKAEIIEIDENWLRNFRACSRTLQRSHRPEMAISEQTTNGDLEGRRRLSPPDLGSNRFGFLRTFCRRLYSAAGSTTASNAPV